MHTVAIRREVYEQYPWVAMNLYKAFVQAQRECYEDLYVTAALKVSLPWLTKHVEDTRALRLDVTRQIRRWRPDLIITQNPGRTANLYASHRDHRITAGVVLDCVYPLARDHLAFPELLPAYEPHRVREVHIIQWQSESHQFAVDISETMELKLAAFACHKSQFPGFGEVAARVRARCAALGKPYGYAYAETFDRIVIPW